MKGDKLKKIIALKCTKEDLEKIEKMALETERSLSGFISYIVKHYLNNLTVKKD